VPHRPRLTTDEMMALRQAALDSVGIVQLPDYIVAADIASGTLEVLLPDWPSQRAIIHAAFPSRRGLVPAVRRFIDFLCGRDERGLMRCFPACQRDNMARVGAAPIRLLGGGRCPFSRTAHGRLDRFTLISLPGQG
jgi:LysR substrate binding domain